MSGSGHISTSTIFNNTGTIYGTGLELCVLDSTSDNYIPIFLRIVTTHFFIFCGLTVSKTETEQNFQLTRGRQQFNYLTSIAM